MIIITENLNTKISGAGVVTKVATAKEEILSGAAIAAGEALEARVGDIPADTQLRLMSRLLSELEEPLVPRPSLKLSKKSLIPLRLIPMIRLLPLCRLSNSKAS